jgi:integrase
MGTINKRKRKNGSIGYTAQILRKQKGKIVFREAKTFDRKGVAEAWIKRRETELSEPGAIERTTAPDAILSVAIDRYIAETADKIGRTKAQVLRSIKNYPIAQMPCGEILSEHIVSFLRELSTDKRKPQTVGNYLSHLGAVFSVARPAWGYRLSKQAIDDAYVVAKKLKLIKKGGSRNRRPTLEEIDRLMVHFGKVRSARVDSAPMQKIIAFAIFSTRRQEEITRIVWDDYERENSRVWVRDMKHPGDKEGNDVFVNLPSQAVGIIDSMPRSNKEIFPYTTDAISAAFTRACKLLGINTEDMPKEKCLHFHDLRHDGVSRLFEMGETIPQAAAVSGHRSWASLKRYSHLKQTGDKYADWKWLPVVTAPLAQLLS